MTRRFLFCAALSLAVGCAPVVSTGGTGSGGGNGGGSSGNNNGGGGGATGSGGTSGTGGGTTGNGGGGTTGNGGGGTTGNGGGGGTLVAVDGSYDTTTQFNLLDALPPEIKTAFDTVIELADSPGNFLLDQADKIPVVKYVIDAINLFSGVRAKIVMAIDEYINNWSGGMVTTMHDLAQQLEMALRGLTMHNHIVVGKADAMGNVSIDDTLVDLTFTWNGKPYAYAQKAHVQFMANVQGLKLTLPAHTYDKGLDFGGMIVDLLDNVALPDLTGVSSLGALLNQLVNCGGVASWVWSYIGDICIGNQCLYQYISANDIAKLCTNALDFAGDTVEAKLASLTAPGLMSLAAGQCLAVENKGHTGHADSLTNGAWSLALPVASATLTLPGTFSGIVSH